MKLRIRHETVFTYDEPITEAYTDMRLRPMDRAGQRCLSFKLQTEPRGEVVSYVDRFSNTVHHFDVLGAHSKLGVVSVSEVLTPPTLKDDEQELSPLDEFDFLMPTHYSPHEQSIHDFCASRIVEGNPLQTAIGFMDLIFTHFKYESGATDVTTVATEVLTLKRGVCQDFAHLMLAACRLAGIPARYVSGYLYDPKLVGANAASHAWVDAFIPGPGWVGLDPTHNRQPIENYVRVGVGRDYADVSPTRGTFRGNGKEILDVNVSVEAI